MKKLSLFGLILIVTACGYGIYYTIKRTPEVSTAGKTRVRFHLQWSHQGQFAGFYLAKKNGYFDAEGLDVEIHQGGFNIDPAGNLLAKTVDIAMQTGDQVLMRNEASTTAQIVALGTFFNDSAACLMSLPSKPIRHPNELIGKRVAVFPNFDTDNLLRALLMSQGIAVSNVTLQGASGAPEQLLRGDCDAYGSYVFNEPVNLRLAGASNIVLRPIDANLTFVSDTVVTRRDYAVSHKDVLLRFMRAAARGWAAAKSDPKAAVDAMTAITAMALGAERDRAFQHEMVRAACNLVTVNGDAAIWKIEQDRWSRMATWLKKIDRLGTNFNENSFLFSLE